LSNISIIGAGYVGLVSGLCFAELGNQVVCIEKMEGRVDELNRKVCPIYENGLEDLLKRHIDSGGFRSSADYDDVLSTDLTFVCVGTPSNVDGSLNLDHITESIKEIGSRLKRKRGFHTVVIKSTVMPGTTMKLLIPELERSSGKKNGKDWGMAVNPEFLREGSAVHDFLVPDRIVIGSDDSRARDAVKGSYAGVIAPLVEVPISTAEMIKVASNSFLAAKISFINEIGNICKTVDVDVRDVAKGMGLDKRIGPDFLRAGCGFGGSCFPKDLRGLIAFASYQGVEARMLRSTLEVNDRQPSRMIELLERHIDVKGRTVAVLGLAFKPQTDDIREATSRRVVNELLERGARVRVHDYCAMDNFRKEFPQLEYCGTPQDCVQGSDAVLIVTEWPGYADPALYEDKLVIDGRGIVRTENYEGICW